MEVIVTTSPVVGRGKGREEEGGGLLLGGKSKSLPLPPCCSIKAVSMVVFPLS